MKKKKKHYKELEDEKDIQWDTGGGTPSEGGGGPGGGEAKEKGGAGDGKGCSSRSMEFQGLGSEEEKMLEHLNKSRHTGQESKRSPQDPLKPIKLKLIPRNVPVGRLGASNNSVSSPAGGAGFPPPRPPLPPPLPPPITTNLGLTTPSTSSCSRTVHSAVVHSSGVHTLYRSPNVPSQQGLQTPPWGPSAALRYGRRCSSPQPPLLSGCTPCVSTRMPPRSAQTSPSAPKSPKLTSSSSDPWSSLIYKTGRAQSIGGGAPPGEMEWLAAPSPRSRKGSWSSVSTDCDSSPPCW